MKKYARDPKSPVPVFIEKNGEYKTVATACGECGMIYAATDGRSADYCCRQQICERCGGDSPKAWIYCSPCRDAIRLEKAVEITEWDGPVYCEEKDRYFSDFGEAEDYILDEEGDGRPEWLFPCKEVSHKRLVDVDSILESATEDLFEDAYDHLVGVEELTEAVHAFNAKQTMVSWDTDYSRKIRISAEAEKGSK